jgi:hypothetical protein
MLATLCELVAGHELVVVSSRLLLMVHSLLYVKLSPDPLVLQLMALLLYMTLVNTGIVVFTGEKSYSTEKY